MTLEEYLKLAMKTDNTDLEPVRQRLQNCPTEEIQNILSSFDTYAQMADGIKKYLMYGKEPKGAVTSSAYNNISANVKNLTDKQIRVFHAILGIMTESQELLEGFCKGLDAEEGIDEVNLAEELGDLAWYQALLVDALQVSWDQQLVKNIDKLKARYGEKFSEERAIVRDLATEREILEKD
jgi:NTP pyrophosphatase (non-canonical NTP hydrolase)